MRGVAVSLDDSLAVWPPARRAGDASLVRAAQGGSEAAVAELFARHWPDAFRTALLIAHDRAAAEDIAQEAFLSALRTAGTWDLVGSQLVIKSQNGELRLERSL